MLSLYNVDPHCSSHYQRLQSCIVCSEQLGLYRWTLFLIVQCLCRCVCVTTSFINVHACLDAWDDTSMIFVRYKLWCKCDINTWLFATSVGLRGWWFCHLFLLSPAVPSSLYPLLLRAQGGHHGVNDFHKTRAACSANIVYLSCYRDRTFSKDTSA